jgi:hypothetical protein
VIICGWCGHATATLDRCTSCGHEDPPRPWVQRGQEAPTVDGRTDPVEVRKRLAEARAAIGAPVTTARLAEYLDVDQRTVRRWQKVAG